MIPDIPRRPGSAQPCAPLLHVTSHAIERAIERTGCKTPAEAQQLLTGPAMQIAASIGARCVRLGSGHRVILDGLTILTVLPAENYRRRVQRQGLGRFRHHSRGIEE